MRNLLVSQKNKEFLLVHQPDRSFLNYKRQQLQQTQTNTFPLQIQQMFNTQNNPILIIKPFISRLERINSAHNKKKIIKRINKDSTNYQSQHKNTYQSSQCIHSENLFNKPQNLVSQTINMHQTQEQTHRFFGEKSHQKNRQRIFTEQGNRLSYKEECVENVQKGIRTNTEDTKNEEDLRKSLMEQARIKNLQKSGSLYYRIPSDVSKHINQILRPYSQQVITRKVIISPKKNHNISQSIVQKVQLKTKDKNPINIINRERAHTTFNANRQQVTNNQQQIIQNADESAPQDILGLNLEFKELTEVEKEMILQKRKQYAKDLEKCVLQGNDDYQTRNKKLKVLQKLQEDSPDTSMSSNKVIEEKKLDESDDFQLKELPVHEFDNEFDIFGEYKEIINNNIKNIQNKINIKLGKISVFQNDDLLNIDNNLNQEEIIFIKKQYMKQDDDRDYESLDNICKRLKFFQKFNRTTRIYLLKLSQLKEYKQNHTIFNQGDVGDLMYIIMRGGVHVRIKRINIAGVYENPVVISLYDGLQFGELALMQVNDKKEQGNPANQVQISVNTLKDVRSELKVKPVQDEYGNSKKIEHEEEKQEVNVVKVAGARNASIETCMNTIVLCINQQYFNNILLTLLSKEMEFKVKALKILSFLEEFNGLSLMPLANIMELKTYRLGQIIVKEGQQPKIFYLVNSGRLKIVKEQKIQRGGYNQTSGQKSFRFSKHQHSSNQKLSEKKEQIKQNITQSYTQRESNNQRSQINNNFEPQRTQNYQFLEKNGEQLTYNYQHDLGSMMKGDIIMGRSLLREYLVIDPHYQSKLLCDAQEPARITVVADSTIVEMYQIDAQFIHLLPAILKKALIDGLCVKKEFDHLYTSEVDQWVKKWDHYKQELMKDCRHEKLQKRNKFFK